MTQDFLFDFLEILKKENMQYIIAVVDKDSKDFNVHYDMFNNEAFDNVIRILKEVREHED